MNDSASPTKAARKGKEREPTDFVERMIAIQRSKAAVTRTKERAERAERERLERERAVATPIAPASPPRAVRVLQTAPQVVVSRTENADGPEETHRRRKPVSNSPRSQHSRPQGKLFNPDGDAGHMRRTAEPESISDTGSSSYASRNAFPAQERGVQHGRLFDYRKDDPVRFRVLAKPGPANGNRPTPTPKSSGEYVSASSTSSYAHSITSSNFTLNSTTDGSSASSNLFDQQPRDHPDSNAFAQQLKKLYRAISSLESKLLRDDPKDVMDQGRVTLKRSSDSAVKEQEDAEKEKWQKFVGEHRKLAEAMHQLLQLTLAPQVPASVRNIPTKYNIIMRLWTHAFNKPLQTLRAASFQSYIALEHLHEFIIFAYTFYSMLLEERNLDEFQNGWLEGLGDLARYRMAIAAVTPINTLADSGELGKPVNQQDLAAQTQSDESFARIDDSPGPSVGVAAARLLELEPEKERWRCIAREWYAAGLAETPGTGKLHHHLGFLSRDVEGEDLRSVYHFAKSMTALHPFPTSRESVLPIWSISAQSRRSLPDARASDLFVLMHGMIFTNIQLDDFQPTLARFMERLHLEGAEQRDWIMMAVINVAAILEYGKPNGVLKSTGGIGGQPGKASTAAQAAAAQAKVSMMVKKLDEMEVDDTEAPIEKEQDGDAADNELDAVDVKGPGVLNVSPQYGHAEAAFVNGTEPPLSFRYALQLTFEMLAYTLRNPTRKSSPFVRPSLNPYNTIILTFLATVLKHDTVRSVLEKAVPWQEMVHFFATIPKSELKQAEGGIRLTSGCQPLPEDWCLRGMEWGGRRVYDRGFWKSGEQRRAELEVLNASEAEEGQTDGIIEDDDDADPASNETNKRYVRLARAAAGISRSVPGFYWEMGTRNFAITGELEEKVSMWEAEDRTEREEEERRRSRRPWVDDDMDIDEEEEGFVEDLSEDSDDDEDDTEEVRALKARRRELLGLLRSDRSSISGSPPKSRPRPRPRRSRRAAPTRQSSLRMVPGYTVLVIDTNILLSSLSVFESLVESLHWTILVPLAVITELDGIAQNHSSLGDAASAAVDYISSHMRSHSRSLKVQTSRGNYLSTLSVRSEDIEFAYESWERNMDDLILRAAIWQDDHWTDRSALLECGPQNTSGAAKVVLFSLDRNLRLKARARQLDAADEKDMAAILRDGP